MSNARACVCVCLCVAAGHMWPCKILPTGTRPNMLRVALGPILDVSGYAFAPASVIAPFTGFNIIVNSLPLGDSSYFHLLHFHFQLRSGRTVVFGSSSPKRLVRIAPCTLGEQLTRCRCIGILIVFVTATLSVFFKEAHTEHWTLERAQEVLLQWRVLAYTVIFVSWLVVNVRVLAHCPHGSVIRGFSLGAISGSLAGNMWCTRTSEPS